MQSSLDHQCAAANQIAAANSDKNNTAYQSKVNN